jgi:hypothetical protein
MRHSTPALPDTEWVRAVLKRAPTTRHLLIDVLEQNDHLQLEGLVPTRKDRLRAGIVARDATTPGIRVVNALYAEEDLANPNGVYAPRWQALYHESVAALAAA